MARASSAEYGGGSRAMVWGRSCPGCVQWPTVANTDLIAVETWRNGAGSGDERRQNGSAWQYHADCSGLVDHILVLRALVNVTTMW
jgi:hypothetical protein